MKSLEEKVEDYIVENNKVLLLNKKRIEGIEADIKAKVLEDDFDFEDLHKQLVEYRQVYYTLSSKISTLVRLMMEEDDE